VAVDTAAGGLDYTAAQFLSKSKVDVPLVFHSKVTTADFIPTLARVLGKIRTKTNRQPCVAIERQNGGAFLIDRLAGINHQGNYQIFRMPQYGRTKQLRETKLGWDTNTATRPKMLADLKEAVDKQVLTLYDKPTIAEMFSFIVNQTSSSWKAEAEKGAHDDLVMSLAIAWQLYQLAPEPVAKGEVGGTTEEHSRPISPTQTVDLGLFEEAVESSEDWRT